MEHTEVPIITSNNHGCCLFKSANNFEDNGIISCCSLTYRHNSKTKCEYIRKFVCKNICTIISVLICFTLISLSSYIINNCIQIENGSLNYQYNCRAYVKTTANYASSTSSMQLTNIDNKQLITYNIKYMFTYGDNKKYGPVSCLQLDWIQSEIPNIFNHNNSYTIYVMNEYYGGLTCSFNKINIDNSNIYGIHSFIIIIMSLLFIIYIPKFILCNKNRI